MQLKTQKKTLRWHFEEEEKEDIKKSYVSADQRVLKSQVFKLRLKWKS